MTDAASLWPWRESAPLLLASGSATRAALLRGAGIPFEVMRPDIDERAVEAPLREAGLGAADRALALARAKAAHASARAPGRLALGSDQTLEAAGHPGAKARDLSEARRFLKILSGRVHALHSAAAVMRDGAALFECVAGARLAMRDLSDGFIDSYLDHVGAESLESVGGYRIEGMGLHLFERVEGEHAVILGLPLTQLLSFLRRIGALDS